MLRISGLVASLAVLLAIGCKPSTQGETETPEATPTLGSTQAPARPTGGAEWGEDKKPLAVTIDNRCSGPVMLFFGQEPRPHSNYYTSLNGKSQSNSQMMVGDKVWIVDEEQYGIASTEVVAGTTSVIIDTSCEDIYAQ